MNSEADLFAGFEAIDKTNGFDPLKAQFRRAEIYKMALAPSMGSNSAIC